MIKNIAISVTYLTLAVFVLVFSGIIVTDYLFKSPITWSSETDYILYNLGDLYAPALGIYLHFWGGVIIMLLGLIQISLLLIRPI